VVRPVNVTVRSPTEWAEADGAEAAKKAGLNISNLTQKQFAHHWQPRPSNGGNSGSPSSPPLESATPKWSTPCIRPWTNSRLAEKLVIDASAMVDYLVDSPLATRVADRITDNEISVPAHFDAEVLSALGPSAARRRTQRGAGRSACSIQRTGTFPSPPPRSTPGGAWARHHNVPLVDALYVELANQLHATIITTDAGRSAASANAEHMNELGRVKGPSTAIGFRLFEPRQTAKSVD
jgi:predicted nucleic acid-binding protein